METDVSAIEFVNEKSLIKPLFLDVFGSEISDALLRWKYEDERGFNLGFFSEKGELIGHVGGVFREVLHKGKLYLVPQMVDLMVSKSTKPGGLSRSGSVFARLMREYMQGLKRVQNPLGMTFGFPSKRAMVAGEKLGVFESVDTIYELSFEPCKGSFFRDSCKEYVKKEDVKKAVAMVWKAMALDFRDETIGVRDYAYVCHRYFDHPEHKYRCYVLSSFFSKKVYGIVFVKEHESEVEIMDVLCRKRDLERTLKTVCECDEVSSVKSLKLWLTKRYAMRLKHLAKSIHESEFRILANPLHSVDALWWLSSGDTEYR